MISHPGDTYRFLPGIPFGQKTETVPKLFGNPVLTRVRKQKLGRCYAVSQLVADGSDGIFAMIADCQGRNYATGDWSSRRFVIIVVKQTSQPLAAFDVASHRANLAVCFDDGIVQSLMIPFRVVMHEVLANSITQ